MLWRCYDTWKNVVRDGRHTWKLESGARSKKVGSDSGCCLKAAETVWLILINLLLFKTNFLTKARERTWHALNTRTHDTKTSQKSQPTQNLTQQPHVQLTPLLPARAEKFEGDIDVVGEMRSFMNANLDGSAAAKQRGAPTARLPLWQHYKSGSNYVVPYVIDSDIGLLSVEFCRFKGSHTVPTGYKVISINICRLSVKM